MMTYEQAVATALLNARGETIPLTRLHNGFTIKDARLALRRLRVRAGLTP